MKKINTHVSSTERVLETQEIEISSQIQTILSWKESLQNIEQEPNNRFSCRDNEISRRNLSNNSHLRVIKLTNDKYIPERSKDYRHDYECIWKNQH